MDKKKKIIITGASSGIGLSIAEKLLKKGFFIIGIGRNFRKNPINHPNFLPIQIDLSRLKELPLIFKKLKNQHPDVQGIICNAGYGCFAHLEEISYGDIQNLIATNFTCHAYLVKTYLPLFKKKKEGDFIFIGSESSLKGKKKGSIYCASKFAIRGFSQALREECSKENIRVCLINPGSTSTPFFQNLSFSPGKDPYHHILPEDLAETIFMVLNARQGTVFEEINISPQKKVLRFLDSDRNIK